MGNVNLWRSGAERFPKQGNLDFQGVVAKILDVSVTELEELNSYTIDECEAELQRFLSYMAKPSTETHLAQEVMGELALLCHRKVQLKAAEYEKKLFLVCSGYKAEQETVSHLKQSLWVTKQELEQLREDKERLQQDHDALQSSLLVAHQEVEKARRKSQSDQVDTAASPRRPELTKSGVDGESRLAPRKAEQPPPLDSQTNRSHAKLQMPQAGAAALAQRLGTPQPPPYEHQLSTATCVTSEIAKGKGFQTTTVAEYRNISTPVHRKASRANLFYSPSCTEDRNAPTLRRENSPENQSDSGRLSPLLEEKAPRLKRRKQRRVHPRYSDQWDDTGSSDSDSAYPSPNLGLRLRQLESLAKDIECFDPKSHDSTIDDYLQEVDRCLLDLPHATAREKLKLIWKTTPRSVHVFMETLKPAIRDQYSSLCRALREEYAPYSDPAATIFEAFNVLHKRNEPPKEYYRRLRKAYFQGRNTPGLEEDSTFQSLFLHNLHDSIQFDVAMHCKTGRSTMQGVVRYAQLVWETRVRPIRRPVADTRVFSIQTHQKSDLTLEGHEMPRAKRSRRGQRKTQNRRSRRQQFDTVNQEDEPLQYCNSRPKQPRSHQRGGRGRFRQNLNRRYKDHSPVHRSREDSEVDIVSLVRRCVEEALKELDRPNSSAAPSDLSTEARH
ncbi:uncharacterized protein LOC129603674 [Betta splendens]|uniref:Uncharacterized protein LOC129603674 n=1 Tax=Betta splendens TaxID=158456 RepID=A0A9W2XK22_BETSP|nr:uncharacterized protein LOC129603674 [Betta splendens]